MYYRITVYIEPEDVLNKMPELKEQVNQCVFSDVRKMSDGTIEIDCDLFNDEDVTLITERRFKLDL